MSRKKSAEATCPVCGKTYTRVGTRKYCSDECRIKALSEQKHNYYVRMKALALGKTEEEVRAEEKKKALHEAECLEQIVERATKLDRKLEELHANGQSYADAQKAETIKQFARVEIPEEFQGTTYAGWSIETPEAPKMLEVFVDPDLIDDEELAKGGLGGHGPIVNMPDKPAGRKKIMYIDSETREFLSELKGALYVIGAVSGNEITMDIIDYYMACIDKKLKGEEAEK